MPTQVNGTTGVDKHQDGSVVTADIADIAVTPEKLSQKLTLMTSKTMTATGVDFTDIPSWAKKITVSLVGVSGVSALVGRLRVGPSTGIITTGYRGMMLTISDTPGIAATSLAASPEGLGGIAGTATAVLITGHVTLTHLGGNLWASSGYIGRDGEAKAITWTTNIQLSAPLALLSWVATTGSFDAGTVGVIYEG